jgi:aminoglycoside 6'-N-acetyltransferase
VSKVTLRRAAPADASWLDLWDTDADVISCSTDDPDATIAFEDTDWAEELGIDDEHSQWLIGEVDGRPIGAMQICDPHLEASHYWGDVAPNLRAVDIWIGAPGDRSKGHGAQMMRLALELCFSDPRVTGIIIDPLASNERAHRFYRRMGFKPVGRRTFGRDDCLVHELSRRDWLASKEQE